MRASSLFLLVASFPLSGFAQDVKPSEDFFGAMKARCVGPTNMGGRIADLAVFEKDARIFYLATASGGLFKTLNAGMTYTPVFEQQGSMSMGSVAVSATNSDVVWVGTGEASNRNSVAWGDGAYKSEDGGKSWKNMGFKSSHHISRVIIDPRSTNTVYVGALGSLWGPGGERGFYKTTDGGKTWKNTLKTDENTGIIDIKQNPKNPSELIAATLQRRRYAYNFISGGPGSGMWKSTDSGETWKKITKGLPEGNLGRIGIDYYQKDPKKLVAMVERPPTGDFKVGTHSGEVSGGLFRSDNGGESWYRVNLFDARSFYFSLPRFDPNDDQRIWIGATELHTSTDGGRTVRTTDADVHADIHALWIDPKDPAHLMLGCDGGFYVSRDQAVTWEHQDRFAIGQFYGVAFDMRKPYWVYGGLQDNGSWGSPTQTARGFVGPWDIVSLSGGDGFHVQVDQEDYNWVYSESQGGAVQRTNLSGTAVAGGFNPPRGEDLRWNWSTPIVMSPTNSKTVYLGSQKIHRTVDRGANWTTISPDLTTNDPNKLRIGEGSVSPESTGAEQHCTVITIAESPRKSTLIWAGTDDGNVQVTQDDGKTWTNVTPKPADGLPAPTWVSRVTPSKYDTAMCYVTMDGHRNNDFNPYVFVTKDYGKTWSKLNAGLPEGDCCYVIKEGTKNSDLLMLGTEMGLWISLDAGAKWTKFKSNFPTVAVHDIAIHPRDLDAVIGTHGRSIWTLNVSALEQMTDRAMSSVATVFRPQPAYALGRTRGSGSEITHYRVSNSQPNGEVFFWIKDKPTAKPMILLQTAAGETLATKQVDPKAGFQSVQFNSRELGTASRDIRVVLRIGESDYVTMMTVEDVSGNVQQTK